MTSHSQQSGAYEGFCLGEGTICARKRGKIILGPLVPFFIFFCPPPPRGGQQDYCPLGTPLCLAWGREMQADVILKEPPSWVPPLSLSGEGTRRGGGGSGPPRTPLVLFRCLCILRNVSAEFISLIFRWVWNCFIPINIHSLYFNAALRKCNFESSVFLIIIRRDMYIKCDSIIIHDKKTP